MLRHMTMRRLALAALLLMTASACSGGDGERASSAEVTPTPMVRDMTGTPDGNRWWLRTPPQRADRTLDLWVHETACASGQPATGRIQPLVDYGDDRITVTITVVYAGGFQTCPGNPDTPYTLTLDEPVGDREIKDGSTSPPTRKGRPA